MTDSDRDVQRGLLERLANTLAPLDAKIDHALWLGTADEMRAELSYLRGLLGEALVQIRAVL